MTILGVDEAGRGPLAGPVAVGVIAAAEDFDLLAAFPGLNDSKQLTEKKREELFVVLEEQVRLGAVAYHVAFGSAKQIDDEGITQTVQVGVWKGVRSLLPNPSEGRVFLDGLLKAPPEYEQETVVGGDGLIPAIMLASVAAKVTRDRLMREIAKRFPDYGFDQHKGYGTAAHYAALTAHGPCEEHRRSFLKRFGADAAAQV
ncbi:MAG: ribonuclease HII [Candidatus Pacebacteria bacterium]|nr:ribonuclease HII [Candidatus Paceibacterota bacterium]